LAPHLDELNKDVIHAEVKAKWGKICISGQYML
jgi:hypothetical protein